MRTYVGLSEVPEMQFSRRSALKAVGAGLALGSIVTGIGPADAQGSPKKGTVRKMGQTILEPSQGAEVGPHFAEESIRADGQYAVVGVFQGEIGSFLVDISNPRNPASRTATTLTSTPGAASSWSATNAGSTSPAASTSSTWAGETAPRASHDTSDSRTRRTPT